MPKHQQRGSVVLFLLLIFLIAGSIAAFVVYNGVNTSSQKAAKTQETVAVALKKEYQNPFDENTQYTNPFSDYHNPFEGLK